MLHQKFFTLVIVLLIFSVAFAVRLAMNAYFQGLSAPPDPDMGADGIQYEQLATNMLKGRGYSLKWGPTSFRAPGFPLLLWLVYKVFGVSNYVAARIVFCIIGALTCVVVFFTATELANEKIGLISSGILALYPHHAYYSMHFLTEPLFTLLLALAILCFGKLYLSRNDSLSQKYIYCIPCGILLGLATLSRPIILVFVPFATPWFLYAYRRELRQVLLFFAVIFVFQLLTIMPWTVRNYLAFHMFVPVASNGGSTFWGGNNGLVLEDKELRGGWVSTNELPGKETLVRPIPNEIDRDKKEWELGLAFLRDNLSAMPRLLLYKFIRFWSPFMKTPNRIFNLVILISYGPLIPFIMVGLFWSIKSGAKSRPLNLMLFLTISLIVISALIFWGAPRFRVTISPFLLIYASLGMGFVYERIGAYVHSLQNADDKLLFQKEG